MFNGVRGEGIKKFFKGRKGRNLSFASNKPVKIQAGADIEEIAQGAVDKNTDNLIIASLKATISDLKNQLAVKEDKTLRSKLEWAEEYLIKFQAQVDKIRKKKPTPQPTPQPKPVPTPKPVPDKREHELKTIYNNIVLQKERVLNSLKKLPFVMVRDDFTITKTEIETINGQVALYEQSVQAYKTKGGTEEIPKIEFGKLKVIYKLVARRIDVFKDELKESSEEKYELKQNITLLEKFADDLVKFASSPAVYAAIRTEVDKELAEEAKLRHKPAPEPEPVVPTPPVRPSYQDAVELYEAKLNEKNQKVAELNAYIAGIELLNAQDELTIKEIIAYIEFEAKIKKCEHAIKSLEVTLETTCRETRKTHKIDISKLTCIQKIKVEKVQYKQSYDLYIEALDKKAIEAIKKIKELELSKMNGGEQDFTKVNAEIRKQYDFLLVVNSLIDRRIIFHSKHYGKDINELYKNRLHNRKAIAETNGLGLANPAPVVPAGKPEIEIFKERIVQLTELWLTAIRTSNIDRKGVIALDEQKFADEMTTLIAHSHDEARLKIIIEASEKFNIARTQLIKQKITALNKFYDKVKTRITLIFQSGTIEENVEPGRDHNEWLTEIEYSELLLLASEPEYHELIPNAKHLINEYIADQEKKYQGIKKRQQITIIENLSVEFAELIEKIDAIPLDEEFEIKVQQVFETMKIKYKALKDFEYKLDVENNIVVINYTAKKYEYSSGSYKLVPQEFAHVVMSKVKHESYKASKNPVVVEPTPVVEPTKKDDQEPTAQIKLGDNEPSVIKVTNRTLKLATNRRQVIDRAKGLIIKNADSLTVSLIKQGLRIRYNENLRDQLKALNAKLSLVNKNNYRSRKSIRFDGEETMQDLAFKSPKENFNIEDYKLEVRLVDDEKKRSDLLYAYDLENISDELHGRTK